MVVFDGTRSGGYGTECGNEDRRSDGGKERPAPRRRGVARDETRADFDGSRLVFEGSRLVFEGSRFVYWKGRALIIEWRSIDEERRSAEEW